MQMFQDTCYVSPNYLCLVTLRSCDMKALHWLSFFLVASIARLLVTCNGNGCRVSASKGSVHIRAATGMSRAEWLAGLQDEGLGFSLLVGPYP